MKPLFIITSGSISGPHLVQATSNVATARRILHAYELHLRAVKTVEYRGKPGPHLYIITYSNDFGNFTRYAFGSKMATTVFEDLIENNCREVTLTLVHVSE